MLLDLSDTENVAFPVWYIYIIIIIQCDTFLQVKVFAMYGALAILWPRYFPERNSFFFLNIFTMSSSNTMSRWYTERSCFFSWNCWSLHYTRKPLFLRKEIKFCTFSSHTEYVKRETIVIAWLTKNKFLLSMNVHVSYVLEHETSKKSFPSVCLYVRTSGRLQNLFGCTITFEGVSASKQNLVGVFYV